MRKRKILLDEVLIKIYTNGSVEIDGLAEFYNKKQQVEIMRMLRKISPRIINAKLKQKTRSK